ncbi:ovomucoid-like [Dreissena polymorpha]|uniref:Kazal-like domain-containing protein n=1 Tax=Dreissena polymorpha TaxID=45954 RepID=A0A9D4N2I8_DREPO|nr:ovomucoid-like [Dreissena polymorpha]KAH3886630.1 hypothetical protein DPMN_010641 [Dreissena polymorpha]
MITFFVVAVACLVSVLPTATYADVCSYVSARDCSAYGVKPVCGTNGVTYDNHCKLATAYCQNHQIQKAHEGACGSVGSATTTKPVNGGQIALDIFCADLADITCPAGGSRVCGSDHKYYENLCTFDKARCANRSLHLGSGCMKRSY